MNAENLKPCPHCGAHATTHSGMGEYWVECSRKCQNMSASREEAIAKWNCRNEGVDYAAPAVAPAVEKCVHCGKTKDQHYDGASCYKAAVAGEFMEFTPAKVNAPAVESNICQCGHHKTQHNPTCEMETISASIMAPKFVRCTCKVFTPAKVDAVVDKPFSCNVECIRCHKTFNIALHSTGCPVCRKELSDISAPAKEEKPHEGYDTPFESLAGACKAINDIHKRLLRLEGAK
jgi:hypothetical protein